ncbi:MAG: nucleotidyltransferase family protein [bacterium]
MIAGVLLAAGGARRFGSQKLVATLDGVPIVRLAARALADVADLTIVVVGSESLAVRAALGETDVQVVENSAWAEGLAGSLRSGILALPETAEGVIVALGDQPRLDVVVMRALIARWRDTNLPIVTARYRGERGHPVLFDRSMFAEVAVLRGDAGAKGLIERRPERVAYVDVDSAVPRDVDTPHDLTALGG